MWDAAALASTNVLRYKQIDFIVTHTTLWLNTKQSRQRAYVAADLLLISHEWATFIIFCCPSRPGLISSQHLHANDGLGSPGFKRLDDHLPMGQSVTLLQTPNALGDVLNLLRRTTHLLAHCFGEYDSEVDPRQQGLAFWRKALPIPFIWIIWPTKLQKS